MNNSRDVIEKQSFRCYGCNACVQICPVQCITVQASSEGFLFPYIDEEKCIHCNLCLQACPAEQGKDANHVLWNKGLPRAYAAWHLREEVVRTSSSGGVMTALATRFIDQGNSIFAAIFTKDFEVKHEQIHTMSELPLLRGSKYVQSDTQKSYSVIRDQLAKFQESNEKDKKIMFVGTPCQVAGLYSYLGNRPHHLVTVDFVCKGVPSPYLWTQYLKKREICAGSKVTAVSFKNKDKGWHLPSMKMEFANRKEYQCLLRKDPFGLAFSRNLSLRETCYECRFSQVPRVADLTLADFWGVEKTYPNYENALGTSLILGNSEVGVRLLEELQDLKKVEVEWERAIRYNKNAVGSVLRPSQREAFFRDFQEKGFTYIEKKYLRVPMLPLRVLRYLVRRTKEKLRR